MIGRAHRSAGLILAMASLCLATNIAAAQGEARSIERTRDSFERSAAKIQITHQDTDRPLTRKLEPVLNWSNPERKTIVGVLYLWTLDARPQVAMCMFPSSSDSYDIECQSLSESPLSAREDGMIIWQPAEAGIRWQELEAGKTAGKTPAARLIQMRQLAREFSAKLVLDDKADKQLRLQTTPVYRYDSQRLPDGIIDGSVFTFVQGTDPEVLLLLEAYETEQPEKETVAWRYALARMTMVATEVSYRSNSIWKTQWARQGISSPYNSINR